MGQSTKHFSDFPSNTLNANMKKNPKEHCSIVLKDKEIVVKAKERP